MNQKQLGRSGIFIPEVGIGTWNHHGGPDPLRCGLKAGALFVDTAESYGTEEVVREAVRGLRDQVFIATKVSPQNFRRAELRNAVDASLARLGIETIDLLQLHHPNPSVPIEETLNAMSELVALGKVRFLGVSNFSITQLRAAQRASAKYPIVSNQVRYNLIDRTIEKGLLQHCQASGVTVIAYSPLARDPNRIRDCDPEGTIAELARITGRSWAQVVLNWCLTRDSVVVIPGGNSDTHVLDNCGASDWRLTTEQIQLLESKVLFRHRNTFDELVRGYMPRSLAGLAKGVLKRLPQGIRRRLH